MEFEQAMRTVKRICESVDGCEKCLLSGNCPFITLPSHIDLYRAEAVLTKWLEEHPERTIADDFFEKHSKAPRDESGMPQPCAQDCGYVDGCVETATIKDCTKCWQRTLEEAPEDA